MDAEAAEYTTKLWEFIRGDQTASEFEKWCYGSAGLEQFLGKPLYLTVIGADFKKDQSVFDLRKNLKDWIEVNAPRACYCPTFKNKETIVLGDKFVWVEDSKDYFGRHFEILKSRNDWVELVRCRHCGETWNVAIDTVEDDVHFLRLNAEPVAAILDKNQWPKDYDALKNVW